MNNFIGKSKIQLVMETCERILQLKNAVREFVNNYDTDNLVYGFEGLIPTQLENGFLSIEGTYENLEDALKQINSTQMAIQILNRENNGRVYRVGTVLPLSECNIDEHKIVNIKTLQEL